MNQFLLVLAVALTVGAIVFGIIALITGDDQGLTRAEPDGRAVPLPADRPLIETDIEEVRFDTALRGYRMTQVDAALRRAAYDIGYKDELVRVLRAEIDALREGRFPDAEVLRRAREAAAGTPTGTGAAAPATDAGTEAEAETAAAEAAERADPTDAEETADPAETTDPAETPGRETAASDDETTIPTGRR